jgi:hypothetical protein
MVRADQRDQVWILLIPVALIATFGFLRAQSANRSMALARQEAIDIGTEAYIYGYPLVTMEMTRRVMTNVARPDGAHAPMGQFALMRQYPDASFHDVTAPDADTLYSIAWLDLSK